MSLSYNFYLQIPLNDLELIVESFKKEFNEILQDSLSDSELEVFESKLDTLAVVFVQPIISELTFDDFYADSNNESAQRDFFIKARSSIIVENLPFLETNPFQVSYLKLLLAKFREVLVDRGGVNELMFKHDFIKLVSSYNSMDNLLTVKPIEVETSRKSFIPLIH